MRIISVIPLIKGVPASRLSYFTKEEAPAGSIVLVPIARREAPALVVESRPASELKSEARRANFSLKKIIKIIQPSFFKPEFMAAAQAAAQYWAAPIGQVIRTFSPKIILETPMERGANRPKAQTTTNTKPRLKPEILTIQERDEERLSFYKSLIREAFARSQSVFFCLPTIADIDRTVATLEKGIGAYTVVLHGRLSQKEQLASWRRALNDKHPVLVIGTASFISLPRNDLSLIILDRENSRHYREPSRSSVDARAFIEELAKQGGAKLIMGDIALRTETIFRTERGDFSPAMPIKYRAFSEAKQELIDIKGKNFEALSPSLEKAIKKSHEMSERFFLLVGRRGLSPTTVCNDCGTVLTCKRCGAPLVLHEQPEKTASRKGRFFQCHRCSLKEESEDKCPACGSWRLAVLGIGIDAIAAEIKKRLPHVPFFKLDNESAKTPTKIKKEITEFLRSPGNILIATEMAIDYLIEPVENTAVAGLDSVLAAPDWRIADKVLALVLRARALAIKRFFIQTRQPEEKIFLSALAGNLLDYYREEISERKRLNYPPFCTMILIQSENDLTQVESDLALYEPRSYEAVNERGKPAHNILIRRPGNGWPNQDLLDKLLSLPANCAVVVDPDSLV